METINLTQKASIKENLKVKISSLWIVIMFNMIFADMLTLFEPGMLSQIITGSVGDVQFSSELMLIMAIIIEVPIVMIFLARVLKDKANRWCNIIAGVITILFVIGGGSTTLSYLFFGAIEVICAVYIIILSWKKF